MPTFQTQLIYNRRAFRQKMKYMSDAFIRGETEVMQELANEIVRGYESIVSNWSATSRPGFFSVVKYDKGTKRYHMRISMKGSAFKKARFTSIDEGLTRSRTVKTSKNGFVTTSPNKVKIGGLKSLYAPRTYIPRGADRTARDRNAGESTQEFAAWKKQLIKEHTTYIGPATQLRGPPSAIGPGKGHDTRMPMRPYSAKTGQRGAIGGTGKYRPGPTTPWSANRGTQPGWSQIPYRYEVTLGDIKARNWTVGLKFMLADGVDRFGASQIWNLREYAFYVARGYKRGVRYAKARQGQG